MSRCVCDNCHGWMYWRAQRGCRLADLKCPLCGGKLRAFKAGTLSEERDATGYRIHIESPDEKLTLNLAQRTAPSWSRNSNPDQTPAVFL